MIKVDSVAALKRLPIGTKLRRKGREPIKIHGNTGTTTIPCPDGLRVLHQVRSKDIVFLNAKKEKTYLNFSGCRVEPTELGFKLIDKSSQDGLGLVEYEIMEEDRCPVCGEKITITGWTTDNRLIGSCSDAFTIERWWAK